MKNIDIWGKLRSLSLLLFLRVLRVFVVRLKKDVGELRGCDRCLGVEEVRSLFRSLGVRSLLGRLGVRSLFGMLRGAIAIWELRSAIAVWEVGGVRSLFGS
ncbi:MAG: hypothetical protein PT116_16185 [Aphanizomenon gracile PMC638.10]|nr:hypothetical protein [Aphanizomenon gracile PMC638.10]